MGKYAPFVALLTIVFLSACVSTKKYDDALSLKNSYKEQTDSLRLIADENRYASYELKQNEADLKRSQEEFDALKERHGSLSSNTQDLLKRYDELLAQNKMLLSNSSTEKTELVEQLNDQRDELDQKARRIRELEAILAQKDADLAAALETNHITITQPTPEPVTVPVSNPNQPDIDHYEAQIRELSRMLEEKDANLGALRNKVNQALLGFNDSDLSVREANGKVYVSLSQNLLFAKGSDQIDWKGKTAIKKVADVLVANPDILVNVEGHTDTDGSAQKNWELSTRRAIAVVNVLTGYGKVDPKRTTASGRSFYAPVASNSTNDGKAKNRRTEIILTPNLDELYKIINR